MKCFVSFVEAGWNWKIVSIFWLLYHQENFGRKFDQVSLWYESWKLGVMKWTGYLFWRLVVPYLERYECKNLQWVTELEVIKAIVQDVQGRVKVKKKFINSIPNRTFFCIWRIPLNVIVKYCCCLVLWEFELWILVCR